MARQDYSVKISECSKELSAKEKLMFKDTSNAIKLDDLVSPDESFVMDVADFAVLSVHNEHSENKDYDIYILIDKDGKKYVTGSKAFYESFIDIYEEMKDESEDWQIEVTKKESNNYKGKFFITCSVI